MQVFRAWHQAQQEAVNQRLLKELQLMHVAEQHHRKAFTQGCFRALVEATANSKEDAAAQARREQTWNKVQGWLAESKLSPEAPARHCVGTSDLQVGHMCVVS